MSNFSVVKYERRQLRLAICVWQGFKWVLVDFFLFKSVDELNINSFTI